MSIPEANDLTIDSGLSVESSVCMYTHTHTKTCTPAGPDGHVMGECGQ